MIRDLFTHCGWAILLIWGPAYLAGYYLTLYSARLFRGPLKEHICCCTET